MTAGTCFCSRSGYREDSNSDEEGEEDGPGVHADEKDGQKFIPFGQIVAASGCSVRATVSCSAGLAADLPIWGLQVCRDRGLTNDLGECYF